MRYAGGDENRAANRAWGGAVKNLRYVQGKDMGKLPNWDPKGTGGEGERTRFSRAKSQVKNDQYKKGDVGGPAFEVEVKEFYRDQKLTRQKE